MNSFVSLPGAGFLEGLAQRLGLSTLAYVPADDKRPAQLLAGDAARLAQLVDAGRVWLAEHRAGQDGAGTSVTGLTFAPVSAAGAMTHGVVVGEVPADVAWSAREDAVLRFCVASCAAELAEPRTEHRARPHPATTPRSQPAATPRGHGDADDADAALIDELRTAIDNRELRLLYQPEYDLLTGRVVAVEALVRWQHPVRGELQPAQFIALAERSGLIKPIGDWVIHTAIEALGRWHRALPRRQVSMRVNVSQVQITDTDVIDQMKCALAESDVPGTSVAVELTEREQPRDLTEVAEALRALKKLGVMSAIDDLATGYSTLSQLRTLPVDMIKIDRSLVTGIDADPRAQSIVTAMMGLALNFGLLVVAEGVQNDREVATLLALGCTRAQGHFLSRPLPADAVLDLLDNEHAVSSG